MNEPVHRVWLVHPARASLTRRRAAPRRATKIFGLVFFFVSFVSFVAKTVFVCFVATIAGCVSW
jgi:hypothetical protein